MIQWEHDREDSIGRLKIFFLYLGIGNGSKELLTQENLQSISVIVTRPLRIRGGVSMGTIAPTVLEEIPIVT